MFTRKTTNGHDLVNETNEVLNDLHDRVLDRRDDVTTRLSDLESEHRALTEVRNRLGNAIAPF